MREVVASFEVAIDWNTMESLFTDNAPSRRVIKSNQQASYRAICKENTLIILVMWKLHAAFYTLCVISYNEDSMSLCYKCPCSRA